VCIDIALDHLLCRL